MSPPRNSKPDAKAIPTSRLARLGAFGRLAGTVAGGVVVEGVQRLAAGERPKLGDLLLTPANATRVTDQLSKLRGAAMKLGQMISLDAGDFLPDELSQILARLRDNAHYMPPQQLDAALKREWGQDWRRRFAFFEARPMAAASIGQVHKARLPDGRLLAIKVQYPGVAQSIDADVDNVATLLRISRLLPDGLDLAPLLDAAKAQLKEEADYQREAAQLQAYRAHLADDPHFVVPALEPDLTTTRVLAMSFEAGQPIDRLEQASQADRDRVTGLILDLVLAELLDFGLMQTDPNFANFRYRPETGQIILLDFGAACAVTPETQAAYRALLEAGLDNDRAAVKAAAITAGFLSPIAIARQGPLIDRMIDIILAETNKAGPFDFADRRFLAAVREQGAAVATDKAAWHIPPAEMLFVQRKISGIALLAARLGARVDVRAKVRRALGQ